MNKTLRAKLRIVRCYESESINRYRFLFAHGWAIFYVDKAIGLLFVASDWGSWCYFWAGNLDLENKDAFLGFLKESDSSYLATKLFYGQQKEVPDAEKTWEVMATSILKKRLAGQLAKDFARLLWDTTREFCDNLDDSMEAAFISCDVYTLQEEFPCLQEWVVMRDSPGFVFLKDELLPIFLGCLRGEIDARG